MPTTPSAAGISAVGQIALTVHDVDRSVAFYRDLVGLRFLFAAPPKLAFFDAGNLRLMLSPTEGKFAPGGGTVIYFKVADIIAAHAAMRARGVAFGEEPHLIAPMPDHDLWMCSFEDPDGNTLELMCERPKAATAVPVH